MILSALVSCRSKIASLLHQLCSSTSDKLFLVILHYRRILRSHHGRFSPLRIFFGVLLELRVGLWLLAQWLRIHRDCRNQQYRKTQALRSLIYRTVKLEKMWLCSRRRKRRNPAGGASGGIRFGQVFLVLGFYFVALILLLACF